MKPEHMTMGEDDAYEQGVTEGLGKGKVCKKCNRIYDGDKCPDCECSEYDLVTL